MALIHRAALVPSKLELLAGWLPSRSWFPGSTGEVTQLGAYRFDDPAGQVGLEAFLLQADEGSVVHVPLTYRGEPLLDAEELLLGTTEHSVLGTRWVYDGCADPAFATALATAVLTGGRQADLVFDGDPGGEARPSTTTVAGSGDHETSVAPIGTLSCHDDGDTTVIRAGGLELVVVRVVGAEPAVDQTLVGRWPDGGPALLAGVRTA